MTATQHDTLTGTFRYAAKRIQIRSQAHSDTQPSAFRYAAKHQPIKHDASSVRHNESSVKLYTNDKV